MRPIEIKIIPHTLLVAMSLSFSGCIKQIEPEQNFGEEVSQSSVNEAMSLATPQHPADMWVGEFVFSEVSAQVEGGTPFVVGQTAKTITGREDHKDYILFSFVEEISELKNGELISSSKEYVGKVTLPKTSQAKASTKAIHQVIGLQGEYSLGFAGPYELRVFSPQTRSNRQTYHSLTISDIFWPVPRLVKDRENCGGLGNQICSQGIPAKKFTFSKVTWQNNKGEKQDFMVVLSAATPFLASQLILCGEAFVAYQGQRVRLTQCDTTKDFRFGSRPNLAHQKANPDNPL